jgi:hypothetical protein
MKHLRTLVLALPVILSAQSRPDAAALMSAQRAAMAKLAAMDGAWRGTAWTFGEGGQKDSLVQTERVGPLLDGSVKVVEGKGYDADGKVAFNAFATISYDVRSKAYTLRSYAMGRSGDYSLTVTEDGFVWEIPGGPGMTIRYIAVIKDGTWRETGDRIVSGKEPIRFLEMTLKRIGDTDWPAAGAVPMK